MPNPFVKLWRYLTASANAKIDEKADPKIQIAQAIEAEQQRHQALANQAAAVLGNQRQLEMRLNRQLGEEDGVLHGGGTRGSSTTAARGDRPAAPPAGRWTSAPTASPPPAPAPRPGR